MKECWRCGDKWMHGHKCKLVTNVHMLQQELTEEIAMQSEEREQEEKTGENE